MSCGFPSMTALLELFATRTGTGSLQCSVASDRANPEQGKNGLGGLLSQLKGILGGASAGLTAPTVVAADISK